MGQGEIGGNFGAAGARGVKSGEILGAAGARGAGGARVQVSREPSLAPEASEAQGAARGVEIAKRRGLQQPLQSGSRGRNGGALLPPRCKPLLA